MSRESLPTIGNVSMAMKRLLRQVSGSKAQVQIVKGNRAW